MKITFLPIPAIVLNLVQFIVEMSRLEVVHSDQMTPKH